MKRALFDNQLVQASPSGPQKAICPGCEGVVELRSRLGTFFWRHAKKPLGGCSPVVEDEAVTNEVGDVADADNSQQLRHQIGDLIIELHPNGTDHYGHHLKLRSVSAEETGGPSGMIIYLSEVWPLTGALLDAAADLTALASSFGKRNGSSR